MGFFQQDQGVTYFLSIQLVRQNLNNFDFLQVDMRSLLGQVLVGC